MATTGLAWGVGYEYDRHVLRGESTGRLDEVLFIFQDPGAPVLVSDTAHRPGDITNITFVPGIRAGPGAVVTAYGVQITTATGQIEAIAAAAPLVRNFLVQAVMTVNGVVDPFQATVRVHVHDGGVRQVWCTPSTLTIRIGAPGQRLAVLAEFGDDTVGDVTNHPGITWASAGAAVAVDAGTGALTGTAVTSPGAPVRITATMPADLGGGVAIADVVVAPAWSGLPVAERTATLIPRPGLPAAIAHATNVLFLSDGFVAGDRPVFEQVADEVVRQIRTSPSLSPFNLLGGSINYWRAFVPSRQSGQSALQELGLIPGGPGSLGTDVPAPVPPNLVGAGVFSLGELIHEVGLPIPADGAAGVTLATKTPEWTAIYMVNTARINAALFDEWKALSSRRLADERDTALGLACGERPAAVPRDSGRTISYHPLRTTREHLDQYLATLADSGGTVIGGTWVHGGANPGKDSDLVVVLCGGAHGGGTMTPDPNQVQRALLVAAGLVDTLTIQLAPAAGRAVTVVPHPVPRSSTGAVLVDRRTLATVVHETAHAYGLGDEYGGSPGFRPALVPQVRAYVNLTAHDDLVVPPAAGLVGERVRWRWPRLSLAGRVVAPVLAEGGGLYRVRLRPGHAAGFAALVAPKNVVHLRQPLTSAGQVRLSGPLEIVEVAGDEVRVRDPAATLVVADYPAESVLCQPVPAPASAAGDAYAELMARMVRTHITTTGGPLNAPSASPLRACDPAVQSLVIQDPTNLPAGLVPRPRFSNWIVGVYEAGMGYNCGVYHPTGICLMRVLQVPPNDPRIPLSPLSPPVPNAGVLYRLCLVCQYALVDRIDASQHGALDRQVIGPEYPQP